MTELGLDQRAEHGFAGATASLVDLRSCSFKEPPSEGCAAVAAQ